MDRRWQDEYAGGRQQGHLWVEWVDSIGSTNQTLMQREVLLPGDDTAPDAAGNPRGPVAVWLMAGEQTQGRGRRGKVWCSQPGQAMTASFGCELAAGQLMSPGLVPLVAGIVIAEFLGTLGASVKIKWPNDLCLLQDDPARPLVKVGGILCEMRSRSTGSRLVIGCGLNLFGLPGGLDADQPVGAVFGHGLTGAGAGSDDALLARVMLGVGQALLAGVEQLVTGGFEPFMSRWQQLDVLAGRPVRVHRADGSRDAVALGIDAAGGLQVRYEDGAGAESLATLTAEQVSIRPRG
jgi:biotin--[acetyl-coA-carboxylase] ligase